MEKTVVKFKKSNKAKTKNCYLVGRWMR